MIQAQVRKDIREALYRAENHPDFFSAAVEILRTQYKAFSYSQFAKKAGMTSRAHAREILLGKRRITLKGFDGVCRALGLSGDHKVYLELLIATAQPDFNHSELTADQIRMRLKRLRARLKRSRSADPSAEGVEYCRYQERMFIYAALSDQQEGKTPAEVAQITKFSLDFCQRVLRQMKADQLISHGSKEGSYRIHDFHLVLNNLGGDVYFRNYYLSAVQEDSNQAHEHFQSIEHLFMSSMALVPKQTLSKIKTEIREILLKYIDNIEDSSGNQLVRINLSMLPI